MLQIYDATLRDGEQREGISFAVSDKLRIAARLDAFGIPYIEGGFPASNPRDLEFFARLPELSLKQAKIVAFGSTCKKRQNASEDKGLRAIVASGAPVAAIVGKAWDKQVTAALQTTPAENLRMVGESIAFLKEGVPEVFFDAEHFFDGYKADEAYAMKVLDAAAQAGADMLVLCDTNGGSLPEEIYDIVKAVVGRYPNIAVGIHAHDDAGLGVANSLAAVRAGATQVQGTMNGYGERVGNADLTTIIPNLMLKYGLEVLPREKLPELTSVSQFVAEVCNIAPDTHHPYVGSAAFVHKGGLHASAISRFPQAYEHIDPELVGNLAHVVVSELAGRASLQAKAAELGVDLSSDAAALANTLAAVKTREAAGYTYETADASLALLIRGEQGLSPKHFQLESFRVIADKREDGRVSTEATIKIHVGDERFIATGEGNGPVNALDTALRMAITRFYPRIEAIELTDYKVRVLDESLGTGAVTRVLIESSDGQNSWGTVGVSENVIEASWDALVDSIEYGLSLKASDRGEGAGKGDGR